jgi:hypothetical protein
VLEAALKKFDQYVNKGWLAVEQYCEGKLLGSDIVQRYSHGELKFNMMGKVGGLNGTKLRNDISSGHWRDHEYQLRAPVEQHLHWFLIADFIKRIREAGQEDNHIPGAPSH